MKKIKIKAKAKINLTLDILGVKDGYHQLKSLVTSVSIADEIKIKRRKDDKITLRTTGISVDCAPTDNNAYKSAKLFMNEHNVNGVDIRIKKRIPVGAGLGGSSADIAGVIVGMKKLFAVDCDEVALANELGSDSGYMTKGGWAIIEGRGDEITPFSPSRRFYALIITDEKSVSSKDSYSAFDKLNSAYEPATDKAVESLCKGDLYNFFPALKNDLYLPVKGIIPEMEKSIDALKNAGALASLMTGGGSAVYGLFTDRKAMVRAYKRLKKTYGTRLIKTSTDK